DEQVGWECRHRRLVPLVVMFWFPSSDPAVTVQPIALLELGAELVRYAAREPGRDLVVGADPGYPRRGEVLLQARHDAPGLTVHSTLADTIAATRTLLHRRTAAEDAADLAAARRAADHPTRT